MKINTNMYDTMYWLLQICAVKKSVIKAVPSLRAQQCTKKAIYFVTVERRALLVSLV